VNFFDTFYPEKGERFDTLFQKGDLRIVRIASGEVDEVQEFCQEDNEWVVVCEGEAVLEIDGAKRELKKGDFCYIPARTPHKLLSVKPKTLWLAVHFKT
jgi:cupin 2 domain-containing protein